MFSRLLKHPRLIGLSAILSLVSGILWWNSTDIAVMYGNYGPLHTNLDITLSLIVIVIFPIFLITTGYKIMHYGHDGGNKPLLGSSFLGGLVATVISGSSCCGLTLATAFGLMPLLNLLPYSGLEVKLIATIALIYGTVVTIQNLETCRLKNKTAILNNHMQERNL